MGCGLWVVGCGLWVMGCGLWVVEGEGSWDACQGDQQEGEDLLHDLVGVLDFCCEGISDWKRVAFQAQCKSTGCSKGGKIKSRPLYEQAAFLYEREERGQNPLFSEHSPGDEMLLVPWCQFQLCPSIHCLLCLFDFFYILYFLYHPIWHVLENIHLRRLRQIPPLEK